ncbi:MAG: sugar-binding domain-containing protein [Candidatus Omnitrophota bacterium]
MEEQKTFCFIPVCKRKKQLALDGNWNIAVADRPYVDNPKNLNSLPWITVRLPDGLPDALFFAGKIPNPWYSQNWRKVEWIFHTDWWFQKRFFVPEDWKNHIVRLTFDNLDYYGRVWLNGKYLGFHEGAYGGPTFEVSNLLLFGKSNELLVRAGQARDEREVSPIFKPTALRRGAFSWGNKLASVGIWNSVRLVPTGKSFLECPYVYTEEISGNYAVLWFQGMVNNYQNDYRGRFTLIIQEWPGSKKIFREEFTQKVPSGGSIFEKRIKIPNPKLWWPAGLGKPHLYSAVLALSDEKNQVCDEIFVRFGIRKLELVRNPVDPDEPRIINSPITLVESSDSSAPAWRGMAQETQVAPDKQGFQNPYMKSAISDLVDSQADRNYRFLFRVNGKEFYANGACWFPTTDTMSYLPDRTLWFLTLARESNIRLLRLNGGVVPFETEIFYDSCDEFGILVWQEIMAGSPPPYEKRLDVWREQLTQNVYRLRNHPSLALWVFGNEIDPYEEKILPQAGISREICQQVDPEREFRPSSPGGGTRHAYSPAGLLQAEENWYLFHYGKGSNFISEWSSPAMISEKSYRKTVDKKEWNDEPVGYDWKRFFGKHPDLFDHWAESCSLGPETALLKATPYGDFNKCSIRKIMEYTQMGQALMYGYVTENWRALFPYHGGETVWCFNQLSPCSSWHTVDWFGNPNIAYYFRKRAYAPYHVLARFPWFSWAPGEIFSADVIAISEGKKEESELSVRIYDAAMEEVKKWKYTVSLPGEGKPSQPKKIEYKIPDNTADHYFFLEISLQTKGREFLSRNCYWLRVTSLLSVRGLKTKYRSKVQPMIRWEKGPWLEPQIKKAATVLEGKITRVSETSEEKRVVMEILNKGSKPAFPVKIDSTHPDACLVCSDNYFWLRPEEKQEILITLAKKTDRINPWFPGKKPPEKENCLIISSWNAKSVKIILK